MEIADIKRLIDIVRNAKISELAITSGTPSQATIKIKKPASSMHSEPLAQVHQESINPSNETDCADMAPEHYISAPMVGIFHGLDGIVTAGSNVNKGQLVGAIESMKLMNDVTSDKDGTVAEVLVEDGMPVEYGQKLFRLE